MNKFVRKLVPPEMRLFLLFPREEDIRKVERQVCCFSWSMLVGFWTFGRHIYVESGQHQPEEKDRLEEEVEGEPVQQDIRERLQDRHESVNSPVKVIGNSNKEKR